MKKSYIFILLVCLLGSGVAYSLVTEKGTEPQATKEEVEGTEKKALKKQIKDYNYVISTQTVGSKYQFTDETMLVETAKQIKNMGSNLLKFSMHPRYCTENYGLPKNEKINSLKKLATLEPSVKEVLDMDFKYYHIWAYGFSQYSPEPEGGKNDTTQIKFIGGYPQHYADALYTELYDLAKHLLTEYNNSGKVFYLGHWEGDWHLRWDYNRHKMADPKTIEGMLKWEKVRQKAIDDAKRDTPHTNVEMYNYIEVNLVKIALDKGVPTVSNTIVKEVNPDFVSFSSYDSTNPYKTEEDLNKGLKRSLDYIESFLKPKEGLNDRKRVWIGEYGLPSISNTEEHQDAQSKWVIKTGLEWGTPFVLFWEMYNNEIKKETGEQVGYWMIDDKNRKQKIWYTHNNFYKESEQYLEAFAKKNKRMPTADEFRKEALNFKALNTESIK